MLYPIPTAPLEKTTIDDYRRYFRERRWGCKTFPVSGKQHTFGVSINDRYRRMPTFIVPNNTDKPGYVDVLGFFLSREPRFRPLNYDPCLELVRSTGIDDRDPSSVYVSHFKAMFGEYRVSRKGIPVFELGAPEKSHHVMISVPSGNLQNCLLIPGVVDYSSMGPWECWVLPVGGRLVMEDSQQKILCTVPQVAAMRRLGDQLYEAIARTPQVLDRLASDT